MRVGVFTDSYRPYTSGVVRSIETYRLELESKGVTFYIFAPRYPGCRPEERVYRFFSLPAPTNPGFALAIPFSLHLSRTLRALRIDLIHVHSPFLMGGLGALLSRRLGLPLVFTYHTLYDEYVHYVPFFRKPAVAITRWYTTGFCNRCDLVFTPTGIIRESLLGFGVRVPVKTLPTGIDLAVFQGGDRESVRRRFGIGPEEPVLIYIGRLGREKNIGFLLRMLCHVSERVPGVRLVLVGGGPQRDELGAEAERLGIERQVIFAGAVPPDEVRQYYAAGDVFVIASLTETQGLVVGEAKAAGLPAVAVRAKGVGEMVDEGVDGFLTPQDESVFAGRVCEILEDRELYERMRVNAVRNAGELSASRSAAVLLENYRMLLK